MAMSRRKFRRTLSRLLLLAPFAAAGGGCGFSSTAGCGGGGTSQSNIPISDLRLSDGGTPTASTSCEELCALAGALDGPCELKPEVGWVTCTVPNLCEGRRPEGLCTDGAVAGRVPPLGVLFAKMAHLEAASVPAFERLADELAAHGAPERLVRAARRSAEEEVRHARAMESLAVRHGAGMPEVKVAAFRERSLEALALENAVEGCVRETFGALLAGWQARCAEEAGIREALARIAPDELRHAELSYAIDAWALGRLSPEARARVEAARHEAWLQLERDSVASTLPEETARQAGLPTPEVAQRLVRELARAMAARTVARA